MHPENDKIEICLPDFFSKVSNYEIRQNNKNAICKEAM